MLIHRFSHAEKMYKFRKNLMYVWDDVRRRLGVINYEKELSYTDH
jgi:hypothetical protein